MSPELKQGPIFRLSVCLVKLAYRTLSRRNALVPIIFKIYEPVSFYLFLRLLSVLFTSKLSNCT